LDCLLELEEGIDGLVHVSDLSWTKKIKHPSEFVKVGEKLDVVVLELDIENKKIALGHKQLEENPWDTFETIFMPGSVHKCTIVTKADKGMVLELPYGLEGFAPAKHLAKVDGTMAEVGESLDFKVLEFSKDDKKILLSHTKTYQADKSEESSSSSTEEKSAKKASTKKAADAKPVEKETLGDIGALANLKEQMVADEKKKK
jgi:small subunit ribosomal protein S1